MTISIVLSDELPLDDADFSYMTLHYEIKENQIVFTLSRSDGECFFSPVFSRDVLNREFNRAFMQIVHAIEG